MGFEMISPLQNSEAQFLFETLHWQYQLFDSPALAVGCFPSNRTLARSG